MILESNVSDGWLSIGKSYEVLEISGEEGGLKFRVVSDDGTPALQCSANFKSKILTFPINWNFQFDEYGSWSMHPVDLPPSFWVSYFDGELDAIAYLKARVSS